MKQFPCHPPNIMEGERLIKCHVASLKASKSNDTFYFPAKCCFLSFVQE